MSSTKQNESASSHFFQIFSISQQHKIASLQFFSFKIFSHFVRIHCKVLGLYATAFRINIKSKSWKKCNDYNKNNDRVIQ